MTRLETEMLVGTRVAIHWDDGVIFATFTGLAMGDIYRFRPRGSEKQIYLNPKASSLKYIEVCDWKGE